MTAGPAPRSSESRPDSMIISLSRNRNYRALWGSQLLSAFGGSAAGIAFPLLVLAVTRSPATVGIVLATSAATGLLVGLPAGAFGLFAVFSGLLSVRACMGLLSVMTCRRVWGW